MTAPKERYRITTNNGCYTVRYMTGGKQKAEDASQLVGYYETLEAAVSGCRNDAIKRVVVERDITFEEALLAMKLIDAGLERAIKGNK